MTKLLVSLITDRTSAEAIAIILAQQGIRNIIVPEKVWEKIFCHNKFASSHTSTVINGVDFFWSNHLDDVGELHDE